MLIKIKLAKLGMGNFGNVLFRSSIGFKKINQVLGRVRGMTVIEIMKISEDCYKNECLK